MANNANLEVLIDTEKKLLSALMLKGGVAVPTVAAILKPDDFYRTEHRLIYKALLKLSDDNVPLDALLLEKELNRTGDIKKVDRTYLFSLIDCEYTTQRVEVYAKGIKEASTYRNLATLGLYLQDTAEHWRESPEVILAKVEERLTTTVEDTQKKVMEGKELFANAWEQFSRREVMPPGVSTGFRLLDAYTGGLQQSDLIILAARPSMGKTALAMNIAANVSKQYSTLIFSLEMSNQQLANRFYAADARVHATKIQHHNLTDDELDALTSSLDHLVERKLYFDDSVGSTLPEIKLRARQIKREHGLDLIIIDYLQLMQSTGQWQGNRVQQVSELSRGLKCLARELDIPVLCLSQLSRNVETRADKRPMLSDLRESGSIEQDADIVMFLYRDEYYDREDTDNKGLAELIVAKNRNGAIGTIPFTFKPEYQLFEEQTRRA